MKKILVVDDSALMRRVICDIINRDERFQVVAKAKDGLEALELLSKNTYDAVVLDVNMPNMSGLELLKELRDRRIPARVMMASTDTKEGAKTTMDALELGALDFVHKPSNAIDCRTEVFQSELLRTLEVTTISRLPAFEKTFTAESIKKTKQVTELARKHGSSIKGNKIVAIASSTGGPKALHSVVTRLPKNLRAPVVLVQHMPPGFTHSLAERLNSISEITISEGIEGETLECGHIYIAKGGAHMNVVSKLGGKYMLHYSDEPTREGVKPCANYMYESLRNSAFDEIVCVVMTGMGADGTKGILNLKEKKKVHVIAQEQSTCAVYGMPRSVVTAGLADQVVPLEQIAQEIILNVGVK
jgi:two-component system chemotaxis response regulator CheB